MISPPSSTRRALVVGADGLVGRTLSEHLRAHAIEVTETTRRNDTIGPQRVILDLGQSIARWEPPQTVETAYICAAATQIKYCEDNVEETIKINVSNMLELVKKLISKNTFTLCLSTSRACQIPGRPLPPDQYTQQKIAAERALLALGDRVAIVRLTKVFAADTPMVKQWQDSLARGQVIHPFSDMTIAPLSAEFVAQALQRIGDLKMSGVTNLSASRAISYADLTHHIARKIGASEDLVQPTTCAAAGLSPEVTGAASILETARMEGELGLPAPDPFDEIDKTFSFQRR